MHKSITYTVRHALHDGNMTGIIILILQLSVRPCIRASVRLERSPEDIDPSKKTPFFASLSFDVTKA